MVPFMWDADNFLLLVWKWQLDFEEARLERVLTHFWTLVVEKVPENIRGSKNNNKWIIEQIDPELSLEAQMTRLKWLYFGHIMWRPVSV